jgi:FkbM family methyltransferase
MINLILKKNIKKILRNFNLKIIKTIRKLPTTYTNDKPTLNLIKAMMNSEGILHIGAHRGTESSIYNWLNKKVLWIEPNPRIFQDLSDNIKNYFAQTAYKNLLGEKNIKDVEFFLSSNDYASSSIFEFSNNFKNSNNDRKILMTDKIRMEMVTLDYFCNINSINLSDFNHWVIDTQGSELQILKGAKDNLKFCNSLYVEISIDEIYGGNSTKWQNLKQFLEDNNFELIDQPTSNHCDVLFIRKH